MRAIARHMIEMHGGTIKAESLGEGQGATFFVNFLLMSILTSNAKTEVLMQESLTLQGIKVLAVDDEIDNLELISFILQQVGATVIAVSSATEALQMLNQTQPDILISDLGMPEIDGYALLRQIRARTLEQGGQIPALALTAYVGEIDHQQALSTGFQVHLLKPVEPEGLVQAIAQLAKPGNF